MYVNYCSLHLFDGTLWSIVHVMAPFDFKSTLAWLGLVLTSYLSIYLGG